MEQRRSAGHAGRPAGLVVERDVEPEQPPWAQICAGLAVEKRTFLGVAFSSNRVVYFLLFKKLVNNFTDSHLGWVMQFIVPNFTG